MNENNIENMNAKDFLKEILFSSRHEELADIIITMQKEKPNEQTNRLLELFGILSGDLFKLNRMII